jgi:peptidylprolyl isomerase
MVSVRSFVVVGLVALSGALSACGASTAPGVVLAPSTGPTASAPAATTTTATTPLPAALSHEPVVTIPKGPPPTHLVVKDLITGTGPAATANSTVTVNYVGVLYKNGKEFDSSWKRNQPFTAALTGGVIHGWTQGIPGMRVGGRRELIIPPSLAYGNHSYAGIPADSTLVFVVDLRSVA